MAAIACPPCASPRISCGDQPPVWSMSEACGCGFAKLRLTARTCLECVLRDGGFPRERVSMRPSSHPRRAPQNPRQKLCQLIESAQTHVCVCEYTTLTSYGQPCPQCGEIYQGLSHFHPCAHLPSMILLHLA